MRAIRAVAFCAGWLVPAEAFSHGLSPGPEGIYLAFIHTLSEMPVPLVILATGLLIGLNGTKALEAALPLHIVGMAIGLIALLQFRIFVDPELPMLGVAVASGVWAALSAPLPWLVAAILGMLSGYFMGVFIGPGPASWATQVYAIAGGMSASVFGIVLVFAVIHLIRERWTMSWVTIWLRVVASWLTAVSTLVAALALR